MAGGNRDAEPRVILAVYSELRRMAEACMRRERPGHTLQATALVHEAYMKLVGQHSVNWQSRAHFFGVAAQAMRRILVDHARGHIREKRGGGREVVPIEDAIVFSPERSEEFLALDQALQELAVLDARQAKIVELRYFGGLTVEETAEVMAISSKTVKRDWAVAKAWLHGELKARYGNAAGEVGNR
jgi:RNA polymerase sigma factor (TIGR02999 family)